VKLLLDTNIVLAIGNGTEPALASELINALDNKCYLSTVALWEIAIKTGIGKLDIAMNLREYVHGFISHGYNVLNITPEHTYLLSSLPNIHKDPFDRLLLSQSAAERMTLLTSDKSLAAYSDKVLYIAK
jgi:PIN domain nuclease of toxin-antitoxin system